MTQEEKSLLLQDLCARLPYGVKGLALGSRNDTISVLVPVEYPWVKTTTGLVCHLGTGQFKPYLRPMSSMTEQEKEELLNLLFDKEAKYFYIDKEGLIDGKTSYLMKEGLKYPAFCPINIVLYTDWLNLHHFDYRGLIPMGLALEAKEGLYNIKNK